MLVPALVFLLGAAFVVLGLVLAVLPGPLTIPPILLGLAVWALEFTWAERLLVKARRRADAALLAFRRAPLRAAAVTGGGIVLAVAAGWFVAEHDLLGAVKDRLR